MDFRQALIVEKKLDEAKKFDVDQSIQNSVLLGSVGSDAFSGS